MNKDGFIQEHSKEKLSIYKQYLKNYLGVLIQSKWYSQIYIHDVCAGSGKDKIGTDGSALIAAKIINDYLKHQLNNATWLKLFVNELNKQRFDSLKKELSQFNFIEYSNKDANKFVDAQTNIKANHKRQNLFFIDPFGYTQYSFENLFKTSSQVKNSEFLVFVPISGVTRFANSASKEAKPSKDFLLSIGINESIKSNNDLINKIVNALKKQFATKFVYSYKLKNAEAHNSVFALFFISKHIKGAEKYLEAMGKVKESKPQLQLFRTNNSPEFQKFICRQRSNNEIYDWSISNGFLPKETNAMLREFQKNGDIKILPENTRKGSFYNSYQHSKNPIKIHIQYVDKQS